MTANSSDTRGSRSLAGIFAGGAALLMLMGAVAAAPLAATPAPYDAVDPFIGTAGGGNTFPGATLPFGMIQWGPDTRADGWYHYEDRSIRGFSLTHLSGAGCPIFADVPILPWPGRVAPHDSPQTLAAGFSHAREQAHPGYYAVDLDNGIRVELTVTTRAGIGRFVFPGQATRSFLIKAGDSAVGDRRQARIQTADVRIDGHETVVGVVHGGGFCGQDDRYALYFILKFSRPFASFGTWSGAVRAGAREAAGKGSGAYVSFPAGAQPILVKVGISYVSLKNAAANLAAEIPGWRFGAIRADARKRWDDTLASVSVNGGTAGERTIFYTGLYHMLLAPNAFSDDNGDYRGFDGKVRRLEPSETQYANFSDWDIYRDVIQLDALLFPEKTSRMMQSLVRDAEQGGWLPRWPVANDVSYVMGGDSSAILLSSAHAFGARSFDARTALRFMLKGATQPGTGLHGRPERPGLAEYLRRGYIPVSDSDETATSVTLEYANADFAISRLAQALSDSRNAAEFLQRSQNWRKLFDPGTGFIRPRTDDGKFLGGWDPDHLRPHPRHRPWDKGNQLGFEEGSTWQYTWMIPYDYAGLFRAMGGADKVVPKLKKFFRKLSGWAEPTFTVTNEPDFCAPYTYVWAGRPWATQKVIDRIRRETFSTKPDGLPGNDDLGATSGVYVWAALGMYPEIPGIGGLVLGTPLFPRAVWRMGNGRTLEIVGRGDGIYVQSVKLNGRPLHGAWLPLRALEPGSDRLEFELGSQPNRSWGRDSATFPPSFEPPPK